MNHQPFENWLLDEEPLTAQQQRDLQNHLRDCTICSGLADFQLALHTARCSLRRRASQNALGRDWLPGSVSSAGGKPWARSSSCSSA